MYIWYLFEVYIYLTLFWCLEVEKLMSKRHQIDYYNISIWKVLSGREIEEKLKNERQKWNKNSFPTERHKCKEQAKKWDKLKIKFSLQHMSERSLRKRSQYPNQISLDNLYWQLGPEETLVTDIPPISSNQLRQTS
jgi:hypothetical protein